MKKYNKYLILKKALDRKEITYKQAKEYLKNTLIII